MPVLCYVLRGTVFVGDSRKRGESMTDRERILERIKAVQALAERGDRGEKENAAAMLERLMKQYGITETELAEDRREIAWFRFKTPLERRLLNQIIYTVTGRAGYSCVGMHTNRPRKMLGLECTAAERLEIEFSFEFYNAALEKELDRFYIAFLQKNRIFPDNPIDDVPDAGEINLEEAQRLSMMMAGMEEHTRRKMLESAGDLKCAICGKPIKQVKPCFYHDRYGEIVCDECCEECYKQEPFPCKDHDKRVKKDRRDRTCRSTNSARPCSIETR